MRKFILAAALVSFVGLSGCRATLEGVWGADRWVMGGKDSPYTQNGHFDGTMHYNQLRRNWQKVENVIDIYLLNYDIGDPYLGAPFFGD